MRARETPYLLTGAKPRIFFLTDGKPETREGFRISFLFSRLFSSSPRYACAEARAREFSPSVSASAFRSFSS
jgi:hypothetical protein